MDHIAFGDCRETMRRWAAEGVRVQMCVTSPPYFGLRDYGHAGQIGLEQTPEEYIAAMVEVFRCVRDVLADDGTLWLNIGDSYAGNGAAFDDSSSTLQGSKQSGRMGAARLSKRGPGLKPKDLIGIPWMLAFALRADGWYLRQDIIWAKPNPMPESVRDRCTKAHEYVFLLSKSERYFYDHDAIKEPVAAGAVARLSQDVASQRGSDRVPGKTNGPMKAVRSKANSFRREGSKREQPIPGQAYGTHRPDRRESEYDLDTRNRRSVWTVATRPYKGAHFATFPPALIEPCILAGTSERGHCPECGARWVREVEREFVPQQDVSLEKSVRGHGNTKPMDASNTWQDFPRGTTRTETTGWRPTCNCGCEPVPDIVLDPFMGSGTAAAVAIEHGRGYLGCELNPEYKPLQDARIAETLAEREAALKEAARAASQLDLFAA